MAQLYMLRFWDVVPPSILVQIGTHHRGDIIENQVRSPRSRLIGRRVL